ncbi:hypothetical protein ABES21_19855, partial [Peribacillus frigoritolerans]|uniref:hypothetical protein n=1 Tax=Peribacillus frigoritolerans TaxID=450367 RepID=UPI003D2685D5
MERKVRDSCGKSASRGDPAGESRGGSKTARGKRVPGVDTLTQKNCRQKRFLSFKTKLIGAGVRDSCGKNASRGDPA